LYLPGPGRGSGEEGNGWKDGSCEVGQEEAREKRETVGRMTAVRWA